MLGALWNAAGEMKAYVERTRLHRRWNRLRELGMHIGDDVALPADTWIDSNHCHLISIGDHSAFGSNCLILAHDAQMDEFLDAARLGRVTIHQSSHIGARCIILPGVEIGPRTVVGAGSVVSRSLPPDTVCAGSPAVVICSLAEYLDKHRARLQSAATFAYDRYDSSVITEAGRDEMLRALASGPAYMIGGRAAELAGRGGTDRTDHRPEA